MVVSWGSQLDAIFSHGMRKKIVLARVCHLVGEKEIVWLCVCFCSRTNVRTDYIPTYWTGSKFCYTLASPYLWASFHRPIPPLSEVRKVRKIYQIWVWNAETQNLMHKVRGNDSSCIRRSSEHICSSSGGAQGKWKSRSKQNKTQFTTKIGAFLMAIRSLI